MRMIEVLEGTEIKSRPHVGRQKFPVTPGNATKKFGDDNGEVVLDSQGALPDRTRPKE